MFWLRWAGLWPTTCLALNKDKVTATIVVDDENDFGSVVDQLKDNDIIKYKGLFRLFSALSGGSDKIAQGSYLVDTDMDYRAILNSLGSGLLQPGRGVGYHSGGSHRPADL